MSQVISRLGYGKSGVIELDFFTRICNEQFYDTEEVRMDRPATFDGTFEYIGLADSGSPTSSAVWNVVRVTWITNRDVRRQFRSNIVWDNRTQGWN